SRVLDLGCGTGRTTIPLKEEGYEVVGIDITPEMIEHAKDIASEKGLDIDYRVGDATDLGFKDGEFECALFSNQGWTQIPGRENRREALEEVYRVLEPGGVFIFTTHVRQWRGYTRFWIKQWIKLHLLKPLGFQADEEEFGDRFFETSNTDISYPKKQYIHIPKVENVIEMVEDVGFELVENRRAQAIAEDEDHRLNPMFYVCRKN
ncbi:MAG: class I SAM-dependent methyltransferase, partial [Candidatus Nanohaloarchaea archaeon]